jgi:hypothetical protein
METTVNQGRHVWASGSSRVTIRSHWLPCVIVSLDLDVGPTKALCRPNTLGLDPYSLLCVVVVCYLEYNHPLNSTKGFYYNKGFIIKKHNWVFK